MSDNWTVQRFGDCGWTVVAFCENRTLAERFAADLRASDDEWEDGQPRLLRIVAEIPRIKLRYRMAG